MFIENYLHTNIKITIFTFQSCSFLLFHIWLHVVNSIVLAFSAEASLVTCSFGVKFHESSQILLSSIQTILQHSFTISLASQ